MQTANNNYPIIDVEDNDETVMTEPRAASQDPDIVESSQEPSSSSRIDKAECFIKIKKVEVPQVSIREYQQSVLLSSLWLWSCNDSAARMPFKNVFFLFRALKQMKLQDEPARIIEETPADLDDTSMVIPATIEPEKPAAVAAAAAQSDAKKAADGNSSECNFFCARRFVIHESTVNDYSTLRTIRR